MVLTMLPVEPSFDRAYPYTLLPILEDKNKNIEQNSCQTKQCYEFCGTPWRIIRTTVGFLALSTFCIMIPIAHYSFTSFSNPSLPRFYLDSLRVSTFNVSEGELSATWNISLTISNNGINSTLINFLKFQALIVYKEDKAQALNAPIKSENVDPNGIFILDENENKTLHLTFHTTGWERDQPIVEDDVIQEIVEQRKLGVVNFGLKIVVKAELSYNFMYIPITMYPYCSNMEVDLEPLERGEVATFDHIGEAKECSGNVEWYMNKYRRQHEYLCAVPLE